ncbi:MAG: pilus assembly protein PilM [Sumerlaeia bacterium]
MSRAIAIEYSEAEAKVLQLVLEKKTRKPLLERAFRVSFDGIEREAPDAPARRGVRLKEAFKQHKISASTPVAVIVPKQSATVRRVRLPTTDPQELAAMVAFEAEKLIPFNPENHIVDYSILEQDATEGSLLLMAGMDETVVQNWLDTLEGTHLDAKLVDVSSLSLLYALRETLPPEQLEGIVAAVHIGRIHTDMTIARDGEIIATRSILHGLENLEKSASRAAGREMSTEEITKLNLVSHDDALVHKPAAIGGEGENGEWTSDPTKVAAMVIPALEEEGIVEQTPEGEAARKWRQRLITNISRTYEFALREEGIPFIRRVFLSGEGATIQSLAHSLILEINAPVKMFDPVTNLTRDPKAMVDAGPFADMAVTYGAALRLARGEENTRVNLIPPRVLAAQARAERRLHYAVTGGMVMVTLVMAYLMFASDAELKREQLAAYEDYRAIMRPHVEKLEEKRDRIAIIDALKSNQGGALEILDKISNYSPLGTVKQGGRLSLTDYRFFMRDRVEIEGDALIVDDISDFVEFLRNLKKANGEAMFTRVEVEQNVRPLPRRSEQIYHFEIDALLPEDSPE